MELNDYMRTALETVLPIGSVDMSRHGEHVQGGSLIAIDTGMDYRAKKLAGEVGEFIEKFAKVQRDEQGLITPSKRDQLLIELGDVLWYTAVLSNDLNSSLEQVAFINRCKLQGRKASGNLGGDGDMRGWSMEGIEAPKAEKAEETPQNEKEQKKANKAKWRLDKLEELEEYYSAMSISPCAAGVVEDLLEELLEEARGEVNGVSTGE